MCLSDAAARAVRQADTLSQELTFLVLHALRGGPCVEAAAALERVRGGAAPRARASADAACASLRTYAAAGSHGARPAAATLLARSAARARRRAADRDAELRRGAWGARGRLLLKARELTPPACYLAAHCKAPARHVATPALAAGPAAAPGRRAPAARMRAGNVAWRRRRFPRALATPNARTAALDALAAHTRAHATPTGASVLLSHDPSQPRPADANHALPHTDAS